LVGYRIIQSHKIILWFSGYDKLAWPDFTNADTEKEIAFVAMAAVKKEILESFRLTHISLQRLNLWI